MLFHMHKTMVNILCYIFCIFVAPLPHLLEVWYDDGSNFLPFQKHIFPLSFYFYFCGPGKVPYEKSLFLIYDCCPAVWTFYNSGDLYEMLAILGKEIPWCLFINMLWKWWIVFNNHVLYILSFTGKSTEEKGHETKKIRSFGQHCTVNLMLQWSIFPLISHQNEEEMHFAFVFKL